MVYCNVSVFVSHLPSTRDRKSVFVCEAQVSVVVLLAAFHRSRALIHTVAGNAYLQDLLVILLAVIIEASTISTSQLRLKLRIFPE